MWRILPRSISTPVLDNTKKTFTTYVCFQWEQLRLRPHQHLRLFPPQQHGRQRHSLRAPTRPPRTTPTATTTATGTVTPAPSPTASGRPTPTPRSEPTPRARTTPPPR